MRDICDDPLLTGVLDELRSWGSEPAPAPSRALASLLVATPPTPMRRRKMITSKLAGLGLAAKVALGLGVTAAAATAGVTTGVLPSPLSAPSASVGVEVTTPTTTSGPTTTMATTTTLPGGDDGTTTIGGAPGATPTTVAHPDNHGACVSEAAHNDDNQGRDHGQAVSAIARSDCGKASTTTTTPSSTTTTPTTLAGASLNRGAGGANGNSDGKGNAGGNGKGNPGRD